MLSNLTCQVDVNNLVQSITRGGHAFETDHLNLERITSYAHATPAGEWYDQERDEWVLILQGRAGLSFAGQERIVEMNPGDFVHIPAHVRHRVEWTDPHGQTVWLALHYTADDNADGSAGIT